MPPWATDAQKRNGLVISDTRTYNALIRHDIETAQQLSEYSARRLRTTLSGIGHQAVAEAGRALAEIGLSLKNEGLHDCPTCRCKEKGKKVEKSDLG